MDTYEVRYGPLPETPPDETTVAAYTRVLAYRVNNHFAVRPVYYPHPAGEGLYTRAAVLDHIPSGRRAFGGGALDANSEEECEAFAASISTLPIDWSLSFEEIEAITEPYQGFFRDARTAAERSRSIVWEGRQDGGV